LQSPGGIPQLIGNSYCKTLAACYDPHSAYQSLTDRENFEGHLGRKNLAFGFSMAEDEKGNVIIDDLKPGSPAFKSGLLNKGDKIVAIQWDTAKPIDVSDASTDEISSILAKSNHDKATITVKKSDDTKRQVTMYKEVESESDDDDKVKSFLLSGDKKIGYISLPSFYQDWEDKNSVNGCANDVAKEIVKLKKDNIDGLVIDLRFNGGGSVMEAVDLAGIFIDAGPITQLKTKEPKAFTLKDANRGTIYDGPMVVMVNGYSASASELLAGALQDYNRALIVGSTTYGKATGQQILPLDTTINLEKDHSDLQADSYVKLTMSQVYRVSGSTAQFTGVVPDIALPDATEAGSKERNAPFALSAISIDANKYYQPLAKLPIGGLQEKALAWQAEDDYFKQLTAYLDKKKAPIARKDISLKLTDLFKEKPTMQSDDDEDEEEEDALDEPTKAATAYKVLNNSFEEQRLHGNPAIKQTNEEVRDYLGKDPSLKVVYKLLAGMAK
jgi:carboxyl-terminal processing protease